MLRRLTLGFFCLACAALVVACGAGGGYGGSTAPLMSGGVPGLGPNFSTNTLYVTSSIQNAVFFYTPSPSTSATPVNQLGGTSTGLDGPQYAAFNTAKQLFVTNFDPATNVGSVTAYQTFATGNVSPIAQLTGLLTQLGQPHGIALAPNATIVVANQNPTSSFPDEVLIWGVGATGDTPPLIIAGLDTLLNFPTGLAVDANNNIFVANRGNASVTVYPFPTPTPVPSATASATPSPVPSGATPAPGSVDVVPMQVIAGAATGLSAPQGLALDANGNIYIADPDNGAPSIREFAKGATGNVAPIRTISGALTLLSNPTDVKVDSTGNIYVIDPGIGDLLIFAPSANGNVAPSAVVPVKGSPIGVALSP